ncbi:MAG TPA: ArsR family transcriptional regulator [Planctomycetaceae bacterium]|nr:ArsR family transcriptional regulator [Planctomycetaceae bacterium]
MEPVVSDSLQHVRPVDQRVLELLRAQGAMTVSELTETLDVTATAVRQRLDRLVDSRLIQRVKKSAGRGRPSFRYELTALGVRYASANYSVLATALWQEVMELPNALQRGRILRRVAKRMAMDLKQELPADGEISDRLAAMASALERRKVPAAVKQSGDMPVLEVLACPYPELTSEDSSRHLCELEQQMLSEAIGQPLQLDCCQLDGHHQCQFKAVATTDTEAPSEETIDDVAEDSSFSVTSEKNASSETHSASPATIGQPATSVSTTSQNSQQLGAPRD